MSYIFHHPQEVGWYTLQHVELVLAALLIALTIALPLGILTARNKRIETPLLGFLGALYTIPSLAMLAILVLYLGLGFWIAIIMLVIYAQYILVRNIATAIREVPRAQVDAGRGLGMSPAQLLWRVEMPQAFPIMLGGVRIAIVALIAIATLASYVHAGGLGVLIFDGLSRLYPEKTIAGSLPAVALAIVADISLRKVEKNLSP